MSPAEQAEAFSRDLDRLVDRYREEFDLLVVTAVGILFNKARTLSEETDVEP
jgi:hypothetical protein